MDLINYQGLNCHIACVINIVNSLGVNYLDAFATLWSETDFTDETKYDIYVSKRIFANLEAIGIITEMLDCDEMNIKKSIDRISNGEMFLIGMDIFDIPWHPVFGHFHGPHYFFAQKKTKHSFLCFDPIYDKKGIKIKSGDIFSSAFELSRIYKIDVDTLKNDIVEEAREILRCHPKTKEDLLAEIARYKNNDTRNIVTLIKQFGAMINNRHMFGHLYNSTFISDTYNPMFNQTYFSKWEAVRNGLYKASIIKDNENVIDEVYELFENLMNEEISMAEEIIAISLISSINK